MKFGVHVIHALLRLSQDTHHFEHIYKNIFLCLFLSVETFHGTMQYLQVNFNLFSLHICILLSTSSLCIWKTFPNRAFAFPSIVIPRTPTQSKNCRNVSYSHKAMAKPLLTGYAELPWDLQHQRAQKPQPNIYSKCWDIFVAHTSERYIIYIFKKSVKSLKTSLISIIQVLSSCPTHIFITQTLLYSWFTEN